MLNPYKMPFGYIKIIADYKEINITETEAYRPDRLFTEGSVADLPRELGSNFFTGVSRIDLATRTVYKQLSVLTSSEVVNE